jgi:glycine betaine/choline ABC-type transport system substrate-binding protein
VRRLRRFGAGLALACLLVPSAGAGQNIILGSTNFGEQLILANSYARVLAEHRVEVEKRLNLGSREIVYPALRAGEVDLVPEYTGALLAYVTEGPKLPVRGEPAIIASLHIQLPDELELLEVSATQTKDTLARHEVLTPSVRQALNAVSRALDARTLMQLNREVGVEDRDPADVAADWVRQADLDR